MPPPPNKPDIAKKPDSAKLAAQSLARLIERQLGYVDGHIDSIALRLFIQAYWPEVATLAHTIHADN